jgi:subtilisin family serine protease
MDRRLAVRWFAPGLGLLIVASLLADQGLATKQPDTRPIDGGGKPLTGHRLLVTLSRGATTVDLARTVHSQSGRVLQFIDALNVVEVRVPRSNLQGATRTLSSLASVETVEREGFAYASDVMPNDPYFPWTGSNVLSGGQWGHAVTHAPAAWGITKGSPNVTVAVVDTGIDDAHPDLNGQLVPGTSVIGGSTIDTQGHGEYVAGVISANSNNGIGGAGYCWTCHVMPVKITNSTSATYGDLASGIVWATDHGARIINASYAGTTRSSTLDAAVSYAETRGALVVAAAGNAGCNCATYPAASPGAIGVAASDALDNLMNYSNFGTWVPVAAPTGDITTWLTFNGQPYGYAPVGGTSISAPVVSGILALMLSWQPQATPAELKTALYASADPISGLTQSGAPAGVRYGRVNAYQALLAVGATPSTDPSPSASPSPDPSPAPSQTVTPSPDPTTVSPRPTASDPPAPSPVPSPQVFTFSGNLTRKSTSKSFAITLPASSVDAQLAFKRCTALALSMLDVSSRTIASKTGPSVVTLDGDVQAGSYTYQVRGGMCGFTLTVTATVL